MTDDCVSVGVFGDIHTVRLCGGGGGPNACVCCRFGKYKGWVLGGGVSNVADRGPQLSEVKACE